MRALILVPVCAATLAVPVTVLAGAGDYGFNSVVDAIQSQYHVRATRIPFMGLISLVARKTSHGAASNLHVAEFENFNVDVDGQSLNQMVEQNLGSGWERIVRETSRNGGDQTLVFMRPEGDRMGLFIVDKSNNEMDVVQVSVDPRHFDDNIQHYSHHNHPDAGKSPAQDKADQDKADQDKPDPDKPDPDKAGPDQPDQVKDKN